eukprot:1662968-Prymnesium_polylepis.1
MTRRMYRLLATNRGRDQCASAHAPPDPTPPSGGCCSCLGAALCLDPTPPSGGGSSCLGASLDRTTTAG